MPRYELTEGTSDKFWEATVNGARLTVRWGRCGTGRPGEHEDFPSAAEAGKS